MPGESLGLPENVHGRLPDSLVKSRWEMSVFLEQGFIYKMFPSLLYYPAFLILAFFYFSCSQILSIRVHNMQLFRKLSLRQIVHRIATPIPPNLIFLNSYPVS